MTLQARLRFNRQAQDSLVQLIGNAQLNGQADTRDALVQELIRLATEGAEIERQLLAA